MARRRSAVKREILPDPKYRNLILAKFINVVMNHGKKAVAEKLVYNALDQIAAKQGKPDPLEIFNKAMDNVRPVVEVRSRRVGGATYQIPVEVRPARSQALAMRWLVRAARQRKQGTGMDRRLAQELADAAESHGMAVKKREDVHKMAEANKAFTHYRW